MVKSNLAITEIVFATGNLNKLKEIRFTASKFDIKIFSPVEIAEKFSLKKFAAPTEDGSTYLENALIKAKSCFEWCSIPSIGDDSGIEADILNNAPGIYSARYAGDNSTDKDKIEKLLKELKLESNKQSIKSLTGRFRCALALVINEDVNLISESTLEGRFLSEPRGERGFGYDPILEIDEFSRTLAEVDEDTVLNRGFRAKAALALFKKLNNY